MIAVTIADDGADELLEALYATPLSESLKARFWDELFDTPSLHAGPEGVT
jgi:hypothetical protein